MVKNIIIETLDKNKTAEILDAIESIKNSVHSEKELNLELSSTAGNFNYSLEIAEAIITKEIKLNATGKGFMDGSAAILLALAKQTKGISAAFFSAEFQLSAKPSKSKNEVQAAGNEVKNNSLLKSLKHLKCNAEMLEEIFKAGEIISAEKAKGCGIIRDVTFLPSLKGKYTSKVKKTGKTTNSVLSNELTPEEVQKPVNEPKTDLPVSASEEKVLETKKDNLKKGNK